MAQTGVSALFVHDKTSEKLVKSGFSGLRLSVCVSYLNPAPTLTDKNVCATAEEILSCTKVCATN